jgi:lycopene beta-cyclase
MPVVPETIQHRAAAVQHDLVLVGGGLQNGLIALACLARDPGMRIALIERSYELGGNHTWAIHPYDVPAAARGFVAPLVAHRWAGYDVRFPDGARTLHAPYSAITSRRFASVMSAVFARSPRASLLLGRTARAVRADRVELEDGEHVRGALVIEARGPSAPALADGDASEGSPAAGGGGFQRFFGLELDLAAEHGLSRPILIDATVPQRGGFRFFYVLPLSPRRLLVEDTVFGRAPALDVDAARVAVLDYAARFGRVDRIVRSELGVLPMPWRSGPAAAPVSPLVAGYQGGFFHPATGYSFPAALRLACHVAEHARGGVLGPPLAALLRAHRRQTRFAERLNRLLFTGFAEDAMWNVFARFYRLPEPLIHRFYALATTPLDRARILVGRPPRGFSLRQAVTGAR